jgi:collagen type I alpha
MVRTPLGDVPAEEMWNCAEIVTLRNGIETSEPVKWVGQRHVDLKRHARPEQVAPVRIRAGAVAEGQPSRDLFVSPEHAIFIDGALIQARALMNGGSIVQERGMDEVTYFHIELESHGAFFADGLAVESYLVPTIAEARVVIRRGYEGDSRCDPDCPDHEGTA